MPFASTVPLSSANGVAIGVSPQGEWLSPAKGFPSFGGSLLLVSDIHIMGLPLSITNRIRCKGAPSTRILFSSRGFPEQGMGFFHRIPTFKERIEFASIASPSPNENGFANQGFASRRSPPIFRESPSPNIWDSRQKDHPLLSEWVSLIRRDWFHRSSFSRATLLMGSLFIKGFASISKRLLASEATQGILRLPKWSVERGTPIQKGSLASPSHHGRLRLQVDNVHNQLQANLEISKSDVLSLASTLKSRCSSLHIIFVDRRLLHIESPLLMLPHLVLIQQCCVDPCPGRLRSPLHDSSHTIDAYSSPHRFSSRSNERYDQRVAYSDLPCTLKEAPF